MRKLGDAPFVEIGDRVTVLFTNTEKTDCVVLGVPIEGYELFTVQAPDEVLVINPRASDFVGFALAESAARDVMRR